MEGSENHNFDLESALRELAAKREAEGLFTCSAELKLQQCTVLLSMLISKGTQPATADYVLCTTVLQAAACLSAPGLTVSYCVLQLQAEQSEANVP